MYTLDSQSFVFTALNYGRKRKEEVSEVGVRKRGKEKMIVVGLFFDLVLLISDARKNDY